MKKKSNKKEIRKNFRKQVFIRDKFSCVICGKKEPGIKEIIKNQYKSEVLDAHHITPRELMENGGCVLENGVTLCKETCHIKAEEYINKVIFDENFSPEALKKKISKSKK